MKTHVTIPASPVSSLTIAPSPAVGAHPPIQLIASPGLRCRASVLRLEPNTLQAFPKGALSTSAALS